MNDRLKFRFWNEQEKRYEDLGNFPNGVNEFFETVEHKVEQCTGLKDKNGRLIYEGDIISYGKEFNPMKVVWRGRYSCFSAKDRHCIEPLHLVVECVDKSVGVKGCEVIGNINENAELLEISK